MFDATAQALESNHARCGLEMGAKFGAEALEEKEFAAFASGGGEFGKVGNGKLVKFVGWKVRAFGRADFVAEAAEDFLEGVGKFFDRDVVATEFLAEIINDRRSGFADDLRVEVGIADQFNGDNFRRTGDGFAGAGFEDQAIWV